MVSRARPQRLLPCSRAAVALRPAPSGAPATPPAPSTRTPSQAGFADIGTLVGVALGMLVLIAGLTLSRGVLQLGETLERESGARAGAAWALELIADELARAGQGVGGGDPRLATEEALELYESGAIGVRGDRDRASPSAARRPEAELLPGAGGAATANDELRLFLRRVGSARRPRALFEADLDSTDRVALPDGSLLARRDGVVESIDAGPFAPPERARAGTLYRVRFVHDARRFGSGRFRVLEPLLEGVLRFRVVGFDEAGASVPPCGGGDDAASRSCRAQVVRVRLTLELEGGAVLARDMPVGDRGVRR